MPNKTLCGAAFRLAQGMSMLKEVYDVNAMTFIKQRGCI